MKEMKKNNIRKGFTLIELLATIAIISIISIISFFAINNLINSSNATVTKVNKKSIVNAAIIYAQEFRMDEPWEKSINASSEEFVCVSVNQLKHKGYLKGNLVDEKSGESYDGTIIKVVRDSNKVISDNIELSSGDECITTPTLEMDVTGDTRYYDGSEWLYNQNLATLKIKLNKTIDYFPLEVKFNGENITSKIKLEDFTKVPGSDYIYELKFNKITDIENHGGKINVDVIVGAIDNQASSSKEIYADFKPLTKPKLTASDNIISDNWHDKSFELAISSEASYSGNYYKYGDSETAINNTVQEKIEKISDSITKTIYVKTCNNLDVCSDEYEEYKIIAKPTIAIALEGTNKNYNNKDWYYDSSNTKIKLTVTSEKNDFTKSLKFGNETITLPNVNPSDNTYTYLVKLSDIKNVKKYGENTKIDASITLNGKTISTSKTINIDLTTPSTPTLTSSDKLATGKWHSKEFELKMSGGGTSPSGIYYMYGYDKSSVNKIVTGESIPVSENSSYTIYVKTCNNVGTCSGNTEYKTIKSVTLVSGKLVISFGEYFEDSTVSIQDVKFEDGDTKVSKIYYLINTNAKKPKTIEEFIEANPTNSTVYSGEFENGESYYGRIAVVDTAGNTQMYRIGYASPGAQGNITTEESEYEYWMEASETNDRNYAWVGVYDNPSGKLMQIKDYKFENKRLEFTVLSTGATKWNAAGGAISADVTLATQSGCSKYSTTCDKGGVYDSVTKKCVEFKAGSGYGYGYCYDRYGNKVDNCNSGAFYPLAGTQSAQANVTYTGVTYNCKSDDIGNSLTDLSKFNIVSEGTCNLNFNETHKAFSSTTCSCNKTGTSSSCDLTLAIICDWKGDYTPSCATPSYTCPSGSYQEGEYCYSCEVGTLDSNTLMCNYTKAIKYKYYLWKGYYDNEIEIYHSVNGG